MSYDLFDFDFSDGIHVDTSDSDEIQIRFNEQTLGIVHGGDATGYSITNDWNNRHFTIGFGENSVLYHLTREDIDDRTSGKRSLSRSEYVAELYGYVRWLATAVPEANLDFEMVGVLDVDAAKQYLTQKQVVEYSDDGLSVDFEREELLINELTSNPGNVGDLLSTVLNPVPFDEIRDVDEVIFFRPMPDGIYLIFLYPGDYVGIVEATEFFDRLSGGGGSQIIDHAIRSITTD